MSAIKRLFYFLIPIIILFALVGCGAEDNKGGEIRFIANDELVATYTESDVDKALPVPPAIACHTFKYWYTLEGGTSVRFTPYTLSTASFTGDVEVYAMYSTSHERQMHSVDKYPSLGQLCVRTISCLDCGSIISTETLGATVGLEYQYGMNQVYVTGIGSATDKNIIIPNVVNGAPVVSVDHDAFRGANIESIVLPSSITKIDKSAFSGCTSLKSVIFAKDTPLLVINNDAFYGCSALNLVSLPDTPTSDVRLLASAFRDATGLKEIYLPSCVTLVGEGAFSGTSGLTVHTPRSSTPAAWHESWSLGVAKIAWNSNKSEQE